MIFLIGLDHLRAQRNKCGEDLTDCQRKFQFVIESTIQLTDPGILAEEDHPDFLLRDGYDSILLKIAKAHRIEDRHRFIDPNDAEREKIGYRQLNGPPWEEIPNRAHEIMHQFPKREEFWLQKLKGSLDSKILLVCGWGHVESLQALLVKERMGHSIRELAIGVLPSTLKNYRAVRRYIEDHPTEFNKLNCFCLR